MTHPDTWPTGGRAPHRGVLILVFGILGLVVCFPFGIAAWVMGSSDLKGMDAGRMDPEGRGLTQAGRILGMVSVALLALSCVLGGLWMVLAIGIGAVGGMN